MGRGKLKGQARHVNLYLCRQSKGRCVHVHMLVHVQVHVHVYMYKYMCICTSTCRSSIQSTQQVLVS